MEIGWSGNARKRTQLAICLFCHFYFWQISRKFFYAILSFLWILAMKCHDTHTTRNLAVYCIVLLSDGTILSRSSFSLLVTFGGLLVPLAQSHPFKTIYTVKCCLHTLHSSGVYSYCNSFHYCFFLSDSYNSLLRIKIMKVFQCVVYCWLLSLWL